MQNISKHFFPPVLTHHVSFLFLVTSHQNRGKNPYKPVSILSFKKMLHIPVYLPDEI